MVTVYPIHSWASPLFYTLHRGWHAVFHIWLDCFHLQEILVNGHAVEGEGFDAYGYPRDLCLNCMWAVFLTA